MINNVVILSGVRTAIGDFGGSLKDVSPASLGEIVIREAVARAGISPGDVEHVVLGQVIPTKPQDAYTARVSALQAGIPDSAAALTVNRLCGSGLQAIISAAQMIALGEARFVVAGGTENMSQAPHYLTAGRFGQKMGAIKMLDALTATLSDPIEDYHMGVTAENIADRHQISRGTQDALAVESHRRASQALTEGRFQDQIVPVEVKTRGGSIVFQTDEHVRTDVSVETLAKLKPAFAKEGSVTAGNASGINDGAAAVVLCSAQDAEAGSLPVRARILSWAHAGVAPDVMGLGPVKAVPIALARAGLPLDAIDIIESNEAFAAQACAVAQELGFDPNKTNVNGSGIALGHPIGATGAILTVKLLAELERSGGRYGLVTMCIGGGQGIAMVIERVGEAA
ncbi:beta-ketothiolase BktB [Sphingomonas sp. BIUV-7]|uniref:Beta-ketothiolase BktB n=1 Tax=Sphingomonas natans TaxID=3063330 RepID=A0ABT8Y9R0_9SPHN|nr:beta-ketothiolase BktB [Sphingomonas sp. BIUV-7]MDO6414434.1 beta-ketothiolase BktB [Sphingomonas sp. BIUV-7]